MNKYINDFLNYSKVIKRAKRLLKLNYNEVLVLSSNLSKIKKVVKLDLKELLVRDDLSFIEEIKKF